jgi:RNA polymerase primary sigma factor
MSFEWTDEDLHYERHMKEVVAKYPVLKPQPQLDLAILYLEGDKRAGEKLLKHNLRLIVNQAKKSVGRGLALEDLVQEGMMGFMKGLGKFDPSRGFKVSTYTTWWIRQGITRAIENKAKMIRIPSHKQQQANKVRWAYKQFLHKRPDGGADFDKAAPNPEDLLDLCDLTLEQIKESGKYLRDHVSLSQASGEDDQLTLADYLAADQEHQPEELVEQSVDQSYWMTILDLLDLEEKDFILYRFGFLDGVAKNRRQMAQFTKNTPAENQRKEEEILTKLREMVDLRKLNNA